MQAPDPGTGGSADVASVRRRAAQPRSSIRTAGRGADAVQVFDDPRLTPFYSSAGWHVRELHHDFTAADALYVALAEALEELQLAGDQPPARAVARHTGVTVDVIA